MFRSQRRPIVTPQAEHLRLVGTLALLWGNADFDAPPIDRDSLVMGIGLHDRGYGLLDNLPIGGMEDDEWNAVARRGFYMRYSDVVADTIAKYHIRRLAAHDESAERNALVAEFTQAIAEQLQENDLSRALFDRIDRITNLCDRISFDFCTDVPAAGSVSIYPRNDEDNQVLVRYRVEDGLISVRPWPFSVASHEGYLVAYRAGGYPGTLDPVILRYRLARNGGPDA